MPARPALLHPSTRRSFLTGSMSAVGGALGLGALTACTAPSTTPSAPTPAPTTGRIVTLDPFSTYNLFDLGLEPVGVQDGLEEVINPRYADAYAGLPRVGTYAEPDLEAIVGLQPDLILASTGQAEVEAKLSQITRTVLVTGTTSSTWRRAATEVAQAVGRTAEVAALEQTYLDRAELVRTTHLAALGELTFVMIWRGTPEGFSVRPPTSNGGQVLGLAGATWNQVMTAKDEDTDTVLSREQLNQIADADVICLPGTTTGAPNAMTQTILDQPGFLALPAVQAGRAVTLDNMTPGSYLNATQLLDEFDTVLASLA